MRMVLLNARHARPRGVAGACSCAVAGRQRYEGKIGRPYLFILVRLLFILTKLALDSVSAASGGAEVGQWAAECDGLSRTRGSRRESRRENRTGRITKVRSRQC